VPFGWRPPRRTRASFASVPARVTLRRSLPNECAYMGAAGSLCRRFIAAGVLRFVLLDARQFQARENSLLNHLLAEKQVNRIVPSSLPARACRRKR